MSDPDPPTSDKAPPTRPAAAVQAWTRRPNIPVAPSAPGPVVYANVPRYVPVPSAPGAVVYTYGPRHVPLASAPGPVVFANCPRPGELVMAVPPRYAGTTYSYRYLQRDAESRVCLPPAPPPPPPAGWVKPSRSSHFTMSNEDFPALPGTAPTTVQPSSDSSKGQGSSSLEHNSQSHSQDKTSAKNGIITNPDGTVSNIPSSMVSDQFGMVGLLTFIRVAESDPNLVALALGFDLTALGLNLNATESLYPFFGGPWGEGPVRAEDVVFNVPQEYNISDPNREGQEFTSSIREKLLPLKITKYKDELLFYLFYTYTGDSLQLLAASELYNRDWRYHKEEKIWICRAPGVIAIEKGQNYERGTYYFFDPISWRKVGKEFYLEYDKLEDRPVIPNTFVQNFVMGS